jgi:hypothetical protein
MAFPDVFIAFPLAGIVLFFIIFISWMIEDVFPPWKNAYPLGAFEAWFQREGTRQIKRRRKNFVDLTEEVMSKTDGADFIQSLIEESKRPDFFMPDQDRQESLARLQKLKQFAEEGHKDSHGYPIIEWRDYRLFVLGLGSLFAKPEVAITILRKDKAFPDSYAWGQSRGVFSLSGFRTRKFLIARQLYFPRKSKRFLGKKGVRVSWIFFHDPWNNDSKEAVELIQTMKDMVQNYSPVMEFVSQVHTMEKKIKMVTKENKELHRAIDDLKRNSYTTAAAIHASNSATSWLEKHLGTGDKKISRPLPAMMLALIPIIAVIIGEYAFAPSPSPTPVLFTIVGALAASSLFASRR